MPTLVEFIAHLQEEVQNLQEYVRALEAGELRIESIQRDGSSVDITQAHKEKGKRKIEKLQALIAEHNE